MRRFSIILSSLLLSAICLSATSTPGVNADTAVKPTIDRLAAATSSTVFAQTHYGTAFNPIFANGSFWNRDGFPYPKKAGDAGWGFSANRWSCDFNYPDPEGMCFSTGDSLGSLNLHRKIEYCPYGWWDCYNWGFGELVCTQRQPDGFCIGTIYARIENNYVWENGADGFLQSGGTLGADKNPDANRVFFSSDNPSYYPSGPQSDVPLDDIYNGGWSLCWVGKYSDPRTSVGDIASSCNQKYVIMAGSYVDPHLLKMESGEISLVGGLKVNQQLSVKASNWLEDSTFSYQWLRDGEPIEGETSSSYTTTLEDYLKHISVRVRVLKPGYVSSTKTSEDALVASGSLVQAPFPVLSGTAMIANSLTAIPGTWDSGSTFTYQWLRDGVAIPSATSSSYTLQASDYLKKISVAVTGSKEGYISETKTSDAVIPVKPEGKIASLRFTGSFKVGEKAYVAPSNRNGKFDYSYQWLRDGVEIPGATSRTYQIGAEDLGSNLSAKVCALYLKDVSHCVSQDAGSPVQLGVLKSVKASIAGVAKVGRMLNSTPVIFDKQATVTYQWLRNGEPIVDATRNSYFIDALDKGRSISLRVTVSKPGFETVVKTSNSKFIN
jgi:hypothetical protein